nr:aminopeptidase N [Dromaius novaehollandiae]
MAAGFFISKTVGIVAIVLALGAVATIIALSVVYAQEKNKASGSDATSTTTAASSTAAAPATTAAASNLWNSWRLPTTLKPESYEVTLRPFLTPDENQMYVFTGNSTVVFVCEEPTDIILIHSNKLNYTLQGGFHTSLQALDGSSAPAITSTWLETTTQYLVVQLAAQLQQGRYYSLFSIFTGELADDLAGFYRSEYEDGTETKVVATTQMEPTDARKAFPCFDEPAMKANFSVTIIHPSDHTALSNMPVRSTQQLQLDGESWNVTEFYTTPKMSTYLLAFIVSQFESVENTSGGVLIRIWGRPQAIAEGQGSYALQVTGPILNFFESHYNTSYPLPKSDQVGLPDFSAGAMENWGLVTYRENSLLYDNAYSSIGNRERVVTVIAHELAHQWFGNLVTLRWWNDLWLNEGFASYVEYLGADSAEPSWGIVIPLINRAQIIDDAFNLARAGYVDVTVALNTTRFLSQETEYMPWQAALDNLDYLELMFDRSEVFGPMTSYIQKQVTPLFEHYKNITSDWSTIPSGLMDQYNEINAISTACSYGISECQQLATAYLDAWQRNVSNNPIPPNLRTSIYCSAVATGNETTWDFIWERFRAASVVSEADKLRSALTCSTTPWILNRYLYYTIDSTKIRRQDATSTFVSIARNVVGQPLAWDFLRSNWETLYEYGSGSFSFSRLITAVTQRFSTEFELQQLEQFKVDNEEIGFGTATRALEQALEKTKTNINWVNKNKQAVLAWFQGETGSS